MSSGLTDPAHRRQDFPLPTQPRPTGAHPRPPGRPDDRRPIIATLARAGSPAIVAEGLVKIYKTRKSEVRALDGVDLVVDEGTVLGLLGPNGAGKTTTVRILATLLRADAGRATVAGYDVRTQADAIRRVIGLSGQYAAVDENLTGRENLWLFGRLYHLASREARRRADELLEQFELTDAADRVVKTYSGGMRRRLDLGAALIGHPRLLILDEPTTGLDPRSRIGMWDVIRGLVKEGTTLLLTTQYLEEADELADTIAVVDHGKIIARGTADELKSQLGGERIEVIVHRRDDLGAGHRHPRRLRQRGGRARRAHARAHRPRRGRREGARPGPARARRRRDRDRRHRPSPADARRRVPRADRARRGSRRTTQDDDARDERREGGMTATAQPTAPGRRERIASATTDSLLIGWRNLKRIPRIPELAIFAILQSIMFVLLFAFVFGGAIVIPGGGDYKSFLMPGIFAQTIVFAAGTTAIGMTDDVAKGIVDRFRSLPIAHSAVLTGRTFADVIYNAGILFVLMATGFVIGWRVDTGIGSLIAGFGLLLLFAYAMVWLGVFLGLNVPTVEVGQQVIFTVLFPITFISTAFVPLAALPTFLQPIAEWNPTSTLTNSLRQLWGNPNPSGGTSLATTEPILVTLAWVVIFIAVFGPLGVRKFRSIVA